MQDQLRVSDAEIVADMRERHAPQAERLKAWRHRWQQTQSLQREFLTADAYGEFMELAVDGRIDDAAISSPFRSLRVHV